MNMIISISYPGQCTNELLPKFAWLFGTLFLVNFSGTINEKSFRKIIKKTIYKYSVFLL